MNEIESVIRAYHSKIKESNIHRYASFDFCFEYFYYNRGNLMGENLQTSCCQLWAYLASWGMIVRGNELQGKSYVSLIGVIQYINKHTEYYDLTIEDTDYIKKMLDLYTGIDKALNLTKQKSRKTLITKIILGVYACCPAYDSNFCTTFGVSTFTKLSRGDLEKIVNFYNKNKVVLDNILFYTHHFYKNDTHAKLLYTPAKLIDMYGFEKK